MEDAIGHLKLRDEVPICKQTNVNINSRHDQASMSSGFYHSEVRRLLVFSSQDENGIKRLESAYNGNWSQLTKEDFSDSYVNRLSYTLSNRRSALLWRSFATLNSESDLTAWIKFSPAIRAISQPRLAFCFTGQGAQWYAMAREIQANVFRKSLIEHLSFSRRWDVCGHYKVCLPGASFANTSLPSFSRNFHWIKKILE